MRPFILQQPRLIFVLKRTKLEQDLLRYGSLTSLRKIYKKQKRPFDRITKSHERQIGNIALLKKHFPDARFIFREELPFLDADSFDLMASVGGDNHFVFVSHFCQGRIVMGINSDAETSTGALLGYLPEQAILALERICRDKNWNEHFVIESWSRIEGKAFYPDGKSVNIPPCTSEISVRSKFHDYISRYLIRKNQQEYEEHKCTGLLLATGAGSTGWYKNCLPLDEQSESMFAKDADFFRSIARETGLELRNANQFISTQIGPQDKLEIISAMDGEITIDADPHRVFEFPPGCSAVFTLSKNRLQVLPAKP